MGLKGYILKRTMYSVVLVFCVLTVNFIIFNLMPGDPIAQYILSPESRLTPEDVETLRKIYGIDLPYHERYFVYLRNMLTFNLGKTQVTRVPVVEEISKRLGNTVLLMTTAIVTSITLGTLIGTFAAYKRATKTDTAIVTSSLILGSLPVFWIGILMLFIFAVYLKWFPFGGSVPKWWAYTPPTSPLEIIAGRLYCVTLPALTLVIFSVDNWTLLTRACVLQTITEDYVVTARAKGLPERRVLLKHVLKPASLPLVTAMALSFAGIFTGAMITETVFSYEGMGHWIYMAIMEKNLPVMYAVFYISGLLVVIANFIVDLVYGMIDPRIKVGR
ncbi:MAG: ABC transporter permease [Candidatus Bathyarchaeota archaeon]|nr:ABC transporter permease [Candidatus Bathyarchaeota archaeon]MDW8040339.1 ABC transporter permease [Nitrososphaerota archaeon]